MTDLWNYRPDTKATDTGFWIFGKQRVIPAGAVKQVNVEEEKVFIDMTKEQVKDAPDHHTEWREPEHREAMSEYFNRRARTGPQRVRSSLTKATE